MSRFSFDRITLIVHSGSVGLASTKVTQYNICYHFNVSVVFFFLNADHLRKGRGGERCEKLQGLRLANQGR